MDYDDPKYEDGEKFDDGSYGDDEPYGDSVQYDENDAPYALDDTHPPAAVPAGARAAARAGSPSRDVADEFKDLVIALSEVPPKEKPAYATQLANLLTRLERTARGPHEHDFGRERGCTRADAACTGRESARAPPRRRR